MTAERAARFPVQTVLSGPAGGVAAARHFGALLGLDNLITYDMGGTSTDVCLIKDLSAPVTTDQYIEDYPVRTPQIDIHTVGAGGGSIAWVDSGDILKVGPRSAGAAPGPACYGRGGTEPTVTDANLVLGRLSGDMKLAGSLPLDGDAAERAVERLAAHFPDLDTGSAAEGIVRIAVHPHGERDQGDIGVARFRSEGLRACRLWRGGPVACRVHCGAIRDGARAGAA